MPQWNYRTIDLGHLPRKVDEIDFLDEVGEEGWELIAISVNMIAFLKRQTEESQAPVASRSPKRSTRRKNDAEPPSTE